ncbi:hypothetical protein GOODEAATRI_005734 [Goodea atripinnis]|uniref:Uncharacterized protein n=1 Tax=Goodea atripinnis TaxID=208336 RepID=A0ABV0PL59_9TELE
MLIWYTGPKGSKSSFSSVSVQDRGICALAMVQTNLQLLCHSWGTICDCYPMAGEHHSPFLWSTMGQVREMLCNTSRVSTVQAAALACIAIQCCKKVFHTILLRGF